MSQKQTGPVPTEVRLHQHSHSLEVVFDDGTRFDLPCEYLRVFSPAAEAQAAWERGDVVTGKERVNITSIVPVGNYAVQLVFDDGHDTGVYSWQTLYDLGGQHEANWKEYLSRLEKAGIERRTPDAATPKTIRLLYFAHLASLLGKESEEAQLPETVTDVASLMQWLRGRDAQWEDAFQRFSFKVAVNKQVAPDDTPLRNKDEVAIVAARPL